MARRALVLGGTSFVGRHAVASLLAEGWTVDVFHRGRTGAGLFVDRGVQHLLGDRDGDVSSLAAGAAQHGGWDACVDVTAYTPEQVERTAEVLTGRVRHYVMVSTVSVYEVPLPPGAGESSPLQRADRASLAVDDISSYGPLKVLAEDAARDAYSSLSVVRPGIVAGPWDPTDRFTSWVRRLAAPGPHPVPPLDRPVQWVDARDLGELLAHLCGSGTRVTANAVRQPVVLGDLVRAITEIGDGGAGDLVVLGLREALAAAEGLPQRMMWPMWLPGDSPYAGLATIDGTLSETVGASYRSVEETVADTLTWIREEGPEARHGPDEDQERRLLEDALAD